MAHALVDGTKREPRVDAHHDSACKLLELPPVTKSPQQQYPDQRDHHDLDVDQGIGPRKEEVYEHPLSTGSRPRKFLEPSGDLAAGGLRAR